MAFTINPTDTITAQATAPGRSPLAIIRLSGPDTFTILKAISDDAPDRPGLHRLTLRIPPHNLPLPIDAITARAPRSYTGENTAELFIPGNPHLVPRVIDLLLDHGVRRAGPGEFSARAYLAGKLSLEQAEGVAQLIAADRDEDLDAAHALLNGATGDRYRAWADRLATLLALVEAGVDFTDQEDVVPIAPPKLKSQISILRSEITTHLGPSTAREASSQSPAVVIVGPPNAGKSTLFNTLLARPRAVVSDTPGTTRDPIDEPLHLGPLAITLTDLAGLADAAASPIDAQAQHAARSRIAAADVLIHCDPTGRFDLALPPAIPTLRVRTKADLPTPHQGSDHLAVCALDGWHLAALQEAITDAATTAHAATGAAIVPRHARSLAAAGAALARAEDLTDPTAHALDEPAFIAAELREALDHLGSIAGHITTDDVIGRVFAAFCVGK